MKVTIECTQIELELLAETLGYGSLYKAQRITEERSNLSTTAKVPLRDSIPNRCREEGV